MELDGTTERYFTLTKESGKQLRQAGFERRICVPHIRRLKQSIMEHGLLNNNIWVWNDGENTMMVFDGQHRLAALRKLLDEGYRQSFTLLLKKISAPDEYAARKIYVALDVVQRTLNSIDVLRAYDSGNSYPFFTELDGLCSHYGSDKTFQYITILRAYTYAKTKDPDVVDKDRMEEIVREITGDELIRIKTFIGNFFAVHGTDTRQWFCKAGVFRNTFRVYWERFPEILPKLQRFIDIVGKDAYLKRNNDIRTEEAILQLYDYMNDKLLKKVNINVKRQHGPPVKGAKP